MTDDLGEKRRNWPRILRRSALVTLVLSTYVGGYCTLPKYGVIKNFGVPVHYREFPNTSFRDTYIPMAWLECKVRNESVCITTPRLEYVEFDPGALW